MDTLLSEPQMLYKSLRRVTPMMPLSQLVEESRSPSNIPNPLLESKLFAKLKSNSVIQADPSELHFSGFELGKDYVKILKIMNISSEVMDIQIIPTQTKHFKTSYTKKYRLIPGLSYTVKVTFCPDEWRYFYDSVRVLCKGEENLLIPVHAYPVIDDLHIPPHIHLSEVPLGQSVSHAIPLKCSCPIDFEFQLFVIQPNEAFSISPLTGVIPAHGEVKIIVTFSPVQYQTSQVTIQLIISQFNTKPYLCTITGSSAPHHAPSERGGMPANGEAVSAAYNQLLPATQVSPCQVKYRKTKEGEKAKMVKNQACVHPEIKPPVDVWTHAGVAKMLIKDVSKASSKDLRGADCGSMNGLQKRKIKETLFKKKVEQNVKDLQANQIKWQVRLGDDPVSEDRRRQITEEKEVARSECIAFEGALSLQLCHASQQRQRALTLFQQAARKVVIRCRMNHRLTCLKKLSEGLKKSVDCPVTSSFTTFSVWRTTCDQRILPARVFPFSYPNFSNETDLLAHSHLDTLPVDTTDRNVTTQIPFFNLQAPQHYRLMGYHPVSALEAFHSYIPTILDRQLRTGALNELVPNDNQTQSPTAERRQGNDQEEEDVATREDHSLTFSIPEALFRPFQANPLRVFNPAPGLQNYKTTPKYLESDLHFHLCPVPRYTTPESNICDVRTQTSRAPKTLLDHQVASPGHRKIKTFPQVSLNCLSNQPGLTCDWTLRRSLGYSADILCTDSPAPLSGPPVELSQLTDQTYKGSSVRLSPEIIRAEFLTWKAPVSANLTRGMTLRHLGELQMEASELNTIGRRVMTRLMQLEANDNQLVVTETQSNVLHIQ